MKNRRKAVQPFEIKKRKIDIFRNYEAYGFEKNQRKFENFSTLISKKSNHWGLTDILRAADRRIGQRRLAELAEIVSNPAAQKILKQRINTYKEKQRKAAEADGF